MFRLQPNSLTNPVAAAVFALFAVSSVQAANVEGQLDPQFGNGGKVTALPPLGTFTNSARAVAVQADGKIMVAGNVGSGGLGFIRLLPDGSPDDTFITISFGFDNATLRANAVAVQSDGKIIVAGSYQDTSGKKQFFAIRFNSQGTIDYSFGGQSTGYVTMDLGSSSAEANAMAIAHDGSIYLAGDTRISGSDYDFALAKLTPDGTLDTTFGGTGYVSIPFDQGGNNSDVATAVALQSDDRILVAGRVSMGVQEEEFGVARVLADGSGLDSSFGNLNSPFYPGLSVASFHNAGTACYDDASAMKIDPPAHGPPSGRSIYVAGTHCRFAYNATGVIAAFNDSGALETDFNGSGAAYVDLHPGYNTQEVTALALQQPAPGEFTGPRLILIGTGQNTSLGFGYDKDMLLARVNSEAGGPVPVVDPYFGSAGHQAAGFNLGGGGVGDDLAQAGAMVGNGYLIIAGGVQTDSSGASEFGVARLLVGDHIFQDGFDPPPF